MADPLGDLVHHPVGRPPARTGHARQPLVEGAGEGLVVLGGGAHHLLAQRERVRAHQLGQAVDPRLDRLGDRACLGRGGGPGGLVQARLHALERQEDLARLHPDAVVHQLEELGERAVARVGRLEHPLDGLGDGGDLGADALADGAQAVVERIELISTARFRRPATSSSPVPA